MSRCMMEGRLGRRVVLLLLLLGSMVAGCECVRGCMRAWVRACVCVVVVAAQWRRWLGWVITPRHVLACFAASSSLWSCVVAHPSLRRREVDSTAAAGYLLSL